MQIDGLVHSTNGIDRIRRLRLFAVVPVVIAAILNTGYQYLIALQSLDTELSAGWRQNLIGAFGVNHIEFGVYDVVAAGLVHLLPVFVLALLSAGFFERLFADHRSRRFDTGIIYTAILFTLLMPPNVGVFHIVFSMSFAIIIAQGIFGGEGHAFLNPALVAVAVTQICFPGALTSDPLWTSLNGFAGTTDLALYHQQALAGEFWSGAEWWQAFLGNTQGLMGTTSVLAVLLGGAVLVYGSIVSWRLIMGHVVGVFLLASLFNLLGEGILALPWYGHLMLGSFAFATVFIATDPSASAATNTGRWIQGILAGALVVFFRVVNPSHADGVIAVLLLVSMTAPLLDHIVMWFNIRRRALRHG